MPNPRITFRVSLADDSLRWILDTPAPSETTKALLRQHADLCALALGEAQRRLRLTYPEAQIVTWALQDARMTDLGVDSGGWQLAWATLADMQRFEPQHAKNLGVSPERVQEIVEILRDLGLLQIGVWHAAARYWRHEMRETDDEAAHRAAGLIGG